MPQRTGNTLPFLVILPELSTLKTPDVGGRLDELDELTELGVLERDELIEELIELGVLERDELIEELIELGVLERDELIELGTEDALDEIPHAPVTPKGEGWLVQVAGEIQLRLFSYPQPLVVVTHRGYTVPYQLHCCTQAALVEEELTDDGVADLDDEDTDDGVDDLDDGATEDGAEEETGPPEHTAPFIVGRSSAPPFLFI